MSAEITDRGLKRREFMSSALALSGMAAAASLAEASPVESSGVQGAVSHQALDPINPDLLFGFTSSIFGHRSIEWGVQRIADVGMQGIESHPRFIEHYRNNPMELKKLFDDAGITFIDASNGGWSTNFLDPQEIPKTIADHVAYAREILEPLGCDHWKINMGQRPPGNNLSGMKEVLDDDQLKRLADTLNELGRQTIAMGIRLAPHPHIWGPMERDEEVRRVMELTDPAYVWMTVDTGHIVLGGGDSVKIIDDFFPRVAEIHLKDTFAKYRGNKATPERAKHRVNSVYHNLGGGGVDFKAVFKVLRDRRWKGWVVIDVDSPRDGDDGLAALSYEGNRDLAVDSYISHNVNYLRAILGVKLPPYDDTYAESQRTTNNL